MSTEVDLIGSVVDLMVGLWKRADRDFKSKAARKAFRDACIAVLKGELTTVSEPPEDVTRDSPEWARFVAVEDCRGVKSALDGIAATIVGGKTLHKEQSSGQNAEDDSDAEEIPAIVPAESVNRRKSDPTKDKRYKANKTAEEIDRQKQALASAREKYVTTMDEQRGYSLSDLREILSRVPEDACVVDDAEYMERRAKNSKPQMVPIPELPRDYRLENEWIKANIKSPDMLYSYVRKKTGDGVTWSGGLRKFFASNDFWEFAFDTLSSGGWCDSETNKPISNVSKYITKVIIGEFVRHEKSKYSIFEGKFKSGKELLDYIEMHCHSIEAKYKTEEYAEWFLQQMNDIGWRFPSGATINNLPKAMSDHYEKFLEWCKNNRDNLVGLNANQYGETLKIQKAIANGTWKPRANGKFSALDLKGIIA